MDMSKVLKVLSRKMDQAESGLIQKVFIKVRGIEIFSEFSPPPVLWEHFKILERLLVFLLAIWEPIGMAVIKVLYAFVKGRKRHLLFQRE
jgi:hypothetical protein